MNLKKLFGGDDKLTVDKSTVKSALVKPVWGKMIQNVMITVVGISATILRERFHFTQEQIDEFMQEFMTGMNKELVKWQSQSKE